MIKIIKEMKSTHEEALEIAKTLLYDMQSCADNLKADNNNQFSRRVYIRNVFATIEGLNFQLKRQVLILAKYKSIELSTPEVALLKEESYELKNNGETKISKCKLRTAENLLFSWNIASKVSGAVLNVDTSATEWQKFQQAIKIRDRITHPKSLENLNITDAEIEMVALVYIWYQEIMLTLLPNFNP